MVLVTLVLGCAGLLYWATGRYPSQAAPLVDALDAALPQTQCAQCGYPGCRPYAQAIANGEAALDLCPPGGTEVQAQLAQLMGEPLRNPLPNPVPLMAKINEADCIGCALCLPACPVDAILGAQGYTHTVIKTECTGCELCVAPCPVDCIVMVAA